MKLMIVGKGGCGKSTVAALLTLGMAERGKRVFLMDADESNIGLYRMLGLERPLPLLESLGGKKGFREKTNSPGIGLAGPPLLFPEKITLDSLPAPSVAAKGEIRIMSLGKIHHFGEGCACPMGRLFSMFFSSLRLESQDMVIVDTAAGVEHFGRRLDGQCDHILCVVDPSYESVMMADRVRSFAREADLPVSLVLNRVDPEVETELRQALATHEIIGQIPHSRTVFLNNLKGEPLNIQSSMVEGICSILEKKLVL